MVIMGSIRSPLNPQDSYVMFAQFGTSNDLIILTPHCTESINFSFPCYLSFYIIGAKCTYFAIIVLLKTLNQNNSGVKKKQPRAFVEKDVKSKWVAKASCF